MFDIYQNVKPCLVSVIAYITNDVYIIGTGFFVSAQGHIVTSAHNIIKNRYIGESPCSDKIHICHELSRIEKAVIVGIDRRADVCVLKIHRKDTPYLKFSNILRLGHKCFIFGCMEDYGIHSFHEGYIERINFVSDEVVDSLITNMKITKGVSGSPICNEQGQVIAISKKKKKKTCGGISSTLLKKIVQKIINKKRNYQKGYSGIKCRPILAQDIVHFNISFLYDNLHGMFVEKIDDEMISDEILHKNDIISTVDGVKIGICSYSLEWFVYMKEPNTTCKIGYYKFMPKNGKPKWDTNVRFTNITLINFPKAIDIPVRNTKGRIQVLS